MAKKKKKKQIVATVGLDGKITKHNKKNNYGRTTGSGDNEKTIVATVGLDGKITKHNNNNNKKAEPITTTKKRSYFNKGLFDDGYDFGDVTKTLVATSVDASKDLRKGVMRIGEGLIDTVAYGAGSVAKAFGNEEFANKTDKFIAKDLIEEQEKRIDKTLGAMSNGLLDSSLGSGAIGTGLLNALLNKGKTEEVSLLGDKSDSIVQSVGQIGGTVGLQAVGVPWYLTTGVTGFGAGTQEALQNDATHGEAGVYGGISAASEIMFEKLGGIKFAGKALDTGLKKALSQKISNKALQTLTKFGIDAGAEGTEEVLTEITQNIGQKLTYEDEKTWSELLTSEEAMDSYLESFIAGAVVGGGFNVGKTINSIKSGRDYDTGLTANEQDVVNREISQRSEEKQKEAAVSARIDAIIEEREKTFGTLGESEKRNIRDSVLKELEDGTLDYSTTAISKKEQREIEKQVEEDLKSGNIGIDSIESVISAEKTNRIKALQQEMETADDTRKAVLEEEIKQLEVARAQELLGRIEKDSYLQESYRQEMLKGKEFSREATDKDSDITKELIESAKAARMNDSKKMHNLFEYTNKIANDTKTKYAFVNNEQLKQLGHHEEGKTINGLVRVSEDGSTKVLINVDSDKALNTIIGHETTHLLEGTNEYKALQNIVKEYATTKGEYDSRYKQVSKLYQGTNANIENEITADLVGDYLFTDEQFINNLSVKEPNVFKRIYEYIKHAYKMATAGSAEARQLEQVKRKFDKAYKQISKTTTQEAKDNSSTETDSNSLEYVNYSITKDKQGNDVVVIDENIFNGKLDTEKPHEYIAEFIATEVGNSYKIIESGQSVFIGEDLPGEFTHSKYTQKLRATRKDLLNAKNQTAQNLGDLVEIATNRKWEKNTKEKHNTDAKYGFYRYTTRFALPSKNNAEYEATLLIRNDANGKKYLYDIMDIKKVGTLPLTSTVQDGHGYHDGQKPSQVSPTNNNISKKGNSVNRELTAEQQEYFKDSKVRDENGNLKVMYHGTSSGGHTVFDPYGKAKYGLFGMGSYFTDNKSVAESYTEKGRGSNKQIYEAYLNITNPIDMDAAADPTAWSKALPDANFPAEGTNEDFYRAMEEYYEDQEYSRWEASEAALEVMESMGYDGITHVGGGRFNKQDETRHRVYIAFQPEQIKNVDNTKPTSNPDIRYSLSDSKGRKLSEGQQEYFKDSVIRDDNGNLKVMYHGSLESFTVFDPLLKGGKNGSAEGFGIYLTDDKEVAQPYANNGTMYEGYVNITKPATSYKKTISRNDLIKLIRATCEIEAQELVDDGEYDTVEEAIRDTWISNYVDTYKGTIEKSYKKTADEIIDSNLNDKNIIHEVMIGSGARTYATAYKFYDTLKATLGIDGLIARWEGDEKDVEVALAFDSNQFKNVDNLNPTTDSDIRYSLSDNLGNKINPVVQKRFENSKVRDDNGDLKVVYHGTPAGEFTVFDKSKGSVEGDFGSGFYFSDNETDMELNYEGGGTDFDNKVARRAEQIEQEEDIDYDEAEERARAELYKGDHRFEVYLNIENPAIVGETMLLDPESFLENYDPDDYDDIDDYYAEVEQLVADDIENIVWEVEQNVDLYSTDGLSEVLWNAYYEGGIKLEDLKSRINELYLETEDGELAGNEVTRQIVESLGYDGIVDSTVADKFSNMGIEPDTTHYIVFKPNQIKAISNENPTDNPDINLSLSGQGEDIAPIGNYNVYGRDVLLPVRETAPSEEVTEEILPTRETAEEIAPIRETVNMGNPLTGEDLPYVEQQGTDAFNSITDDMAPVEMEEPIYEEDEPAADPVNPLEADGRDIEDVGKRSIKAYMYENPEVKPFFQAEAEYMLNDLKNSVKGQKHYNDQLYYDSSGEQGWYGTKRQTSDEIAYLLDNFKYSYADIEKGLKAIIEDHGAENNAISKRIEFMIDERLREGYDDMMYGDSVPPNEEYINLLREKQITEYSDEAYEAWARTLENVEAPTDPITEGGIDYIQNLSREAGIDTADVTRRYGVESIEEMTREQYMDAVKWLDQEAIAPVRVPEATEDIAPIREDIPISQGVQQEVKEDGSIGDVPEDLPSKTRRDLRKDLLVDGTDFFQRTLDNAKNRAMALLNNTDTIRVQELVFGREAGNRINEAIFQKAIDNEARSIYWQNKQRSDIKALGIKPKSKMSAAVQKYGEGEYVNKFGDLTPYGEIDLMTEFPNESDQEKIKEAARIIKQKYERYIDQANDVLTRLGFDPIPKRKDYMRHFQELNDAFSRFGIPFNAQSMQEHVLPTDVNGLTEFWSPQKSFFANTQPRKGLRTEYDAITGIDGYLSGIANLIFHTEDIQRGRAFEEMIRERFGQENAEEVLENTPEEDRPALLQKIQDNHLSNYAAWVHEWTNNIAGKKNKVDRSIESMFGRRAFSFLDTTRKQVGANMIGFNIASSLTNLISPVQAISKTNKIAVAKGTLDTFKNIVRKDGFVDQNAFLTSRFGTDMLSKTPWQKIQDAGYVFMKGVDHFSSNLIVRSKYNELISKGMSEKEAHAEAGKFAARIMGDRSKGANAALYNSKLIGLVTQFQLEVNNQLYSMFYDTVHESKEKAQGNALKMAAGMTFTLGQLFAFTHLFGKAFEGVAGYNPTFDVVGIIQTLFGIGGDDEEEKPFSERAEAATMQLLKSLPYTSTFTGGRIPIGQAFPVKQLVTGKDEYGNDKARPETLKETLPYYVLPGGYSQIKKTAQGLGMFDDDLPVAGSYTDSGNLRFPVEDTLPNKAQAAVFGQWANKNAQDYIDNERAPLKEKQIQEYKELDLPIADYWKIREGLKGKKTLEKKFDYIADLDLPVAKKNILINNAVNRKEDIDLEDYSDFGSYEEFDFAMKNPEKYAMAQAVGGYKKYKKYSDTLYNIKANKDKNGESVRNSRKMKVVNYINGLEIPDVEKYILFKSEYNSDDTYNREIIDYLYGRSDITHEQREAILTQLGFEVSGDTVYW